MLHANPTLHSVCLTLSLSVVLSTMTGCSGGTPTTAPPAKQETSAPTPAASTAQQSAMQVAATGPKSKTKWIGDIPYDVFYDQPLAIAADSTSLAPSIATPAVPATTSTMPANSGTDTTPQPAATAAAGGGPDWQQLVSVDVLNEAVTKLRNRLTTNLNTLANYNRNIETIANDGACLGALAAVAEVHPDAVSWKDKAKYIRDRGNEIFLKADGTGREPYDATKEPFEQIVAMLNGGPPPDVQAEDKVPFADIVDRSELMKRIKQSYDYLRTEVNTEGRFKELPEDIIREASVLASFGGMISTESYDSADQQKYQQFVRDFMQADMDVVAATKAGDFGQFEDARNRIQKACDTCHGEYAFGGDSF